MLKHRITILVIILSLFIGGTVTGKKNVDMPIKKIVSQYYKDLPLFIGCAGHQTAIGKTSGNILDREFNYVTPSNDFKQTTIHPTPKVWQWKKPDAWIEHVKTTNQILRLHAPISPQCSKWVKDDKRTASELNTMLEEYLITLYKRYGSEKSVKWVDVVNETIFHENKPDSLGDLTVGGWFTRRSGTEKWENPWTLLGFDESTELKVPLYIDKSFEIAEKYAPNVKLIFNQQGQGEPEVWDKVKKTVLYLCNVKHRRVDGIGWQAHVEAGWEKNPANMQFLSDIIDWCHARKLEFHITEFNVYTNKSKVKYTDEEQAATFSEITKLMLSKLKTGVIGINFWNIQDDETGMPEWRGAMWDEKGNPKQSYFKFKETLIQSSNFYK